MVFVYLFFFANLLFCLAYVVRDMAWLRALTILAATCTLPYFYFQYQPLYSAMGWQLAFIAINGVNLTILLLERRPVSLTREEKKLHSMTFRTLTPREMLKLLEPARWSQLEAGQVMVDQGEELNRLLLIFEGRAEVRVNGEFKANLGPGDFVGEMSFVTGNLTSAEVVTTEPVRYLTWTRDDLEKLYRRNRDFRDAVQAILGIDMARKLSRRPVQNRDRPAES